MTRRDHIRHALDVIYDQIFNKGQVDLLPSLVSGPYIQHPSDVSLLPLSRRRRGKLNMKLSGSHLVFLSDETLPFHFPIRVTDITPNLRGSSPVGFEVFVL